MKISAQKKPALYVETLSPGTELPNEENQKAGKWDEQLTLTIGVNEM